MFAEGTRSRDGSVGKLRSGAAVLAAQHGLSLVPIYVSGSHAAMPVGRYWPRSRRVASAIPSRSASARRSGPRDARAPQRASWSGCRDHARAFLTRGPHLRTRRHAGFIGGALCHPAASSAATSSSRSRARTPAAAKVGARGAEVARGDAARRGLAGRRRWPAATLVYHCAGINSHCPPDPEHAAARQRGGAERRGAGGGAGGCAPGRLHVVGRLGRRGRGTIGDEHSAAPRLLPVGLRPLQARGRAGRVRGRAPDRASRSSRSTRPRSRALAAHPATARSSSTTSTASCRCSSTSTSAWSTSPTLFEAHICSRPSAGARGARYVLNGATLHVARGARASSPRSPASRHRVRIVPPAVAMRRPPVAEGAYRAARAGVPRCAARASARSCTATATTARWPSASSGWSTRRWPRRSGGRSRGRGRRGWSRVARAGPRQRRARTRPPRPSRRAARR